MKNLNLFFLLLLPLGAQSQAILNKWIMNANGKKASYWATTGQGMNVSYSFVNSNDLADVLQVCYNDTEVFVRSNGVTDNMGKFLNPGTCVAFAYVFKLPRNPTVPTTKSIAPKVGQIAVLTNGLVIYGLGNASSWNGTANVNRGTGIWNMEVGLSEGFTLDTAFGAHPQQQGAYHSHNTPYRLYKSSPSTTHSPLVGFAFDGYPIYGPYGYVSPMNAASGVTRMKTGYALRNISNRNLLPYGVTPTQVGPPINATYPLGTYCEDYEWSAANGGDLDKYNGRFCVTPDYPNGTYAYFTTIDAAGKPAFPYYIGIEYYGAPITSNYPIPGQNITSNTMPTSGYTCFTTQKTSVNDYTDRKDSLGEGGASFRIAPNPTQGKATIQWDEAVFNRLEVFNNIGQLVHSQTVGQQKQVAIDLSTMPVGLYFVRCRQTETGRLSVQKLILE
jgi:hypothetical protein